MVVFRVVNATGNVVAAYDNIDDALTDARGRNAGLTPPNTALDDGWHVVQGVI